MRVLVVDDHEIVRAGLRATLAADASVTVVAAAATGAQALRLLRRHRPDVVLTDYRLPDLRGDELCRSVLLERPAATVVVLTTYLSEEIVRQVTAAGAHGFVTKAAGLVALRAALARAVDGRRSDLADRCPTAVVRDIRGADGSEAAEEISPQQARVLELTVQGLTYAEIGQRLYISESTVRYHVRRLKERLGSRTKAELVATAIRSALVPPAEAAPAA